jgi:methionyl-tRNA formyltransferase
VAQPERSQELAAILERAGPLDLGLLVAYGALVRPEALAVPRAGILNVHFSLLPRWRGAAPVPRAMLAGDTRTGVSIMRLDPGLDTGPVVAMTSTAIAPDETGGEVTARLARLGAELTVAVLAPYLAGRVVTVPQPGTGVTEAPKLSGDDRAIDWTHPPPETLARIMALSPRPGAVTRWRGEPFRILRACPAGGTGLGPGAITGPRPVRVGCAGGEIELVEVQPAGRSPMAAEAWFRGVRPAPMGFD